MTTRQRITVTGRVQGVGYRMHCSREAKRLGLSGTVRNRADGSVEVVAEGDADLVTQLIDWCRTGPPFADVRGVTTSDEAPEGVRSFRVLT